MATPSSADIVPIVADKGVVQLWAGLLALGVLLLLVVLVRGRRLKPAYSLIWFAGWGVLAVLIAFPDALDGLGQLLGIHYSPTLLLLGVVCTMGLVLLHVTTVITRQGRQINRLAQEIALLQEKTPPSDGD